MTRSGVSQPLLPDRPLQPARSRRTIAVFCCFRLPALNRRDVRVWGGGSSTVVNHEKAVVDRRCRRRNPFQSTIDCQRRDEVDSGWLPDCIPLLPVGLDRGTNQPPTHLLAVVVFRFWLQDLFSCVVFPEHVSLVEFQILGHTALLGVVPVPACVVRDRAPNC